MFKNSQLRREFPHDVKLPVIIKIKKTTILYGKFTSMNEKYLSSTQQANEQCKSNLKMSLLFLTYLRDAIYQSQDRRLFNKH